MFYPGLSGSGCGCRTPDVVHSSRPPERPGGGGGGGSGVRIADRSGSGPGGHPHHRICRRLAATILETYPRLDVLINNAGILRTDGHTESVDGYEMVFQVNDLSHFLLTHQLLPLLKASAPDRIANVASAAQSPVDFDDVMLEREGAIGRAYGQSRLAQILHAFDPAARRKLHDLGRQWVGLDPA